MADLGSWEHDCLTGEEFWSANLCRILGQTPSDTKVQSEVFWDLVHPADREMVRNTIEWGMRDRQPYEYQARFLLPDGHERSFLVRGTVVVDSLNRVLKRCGVAQDITARVEIERDLLRSEERYRDLVENCGNLMCTHDLDGTLLSMNERPAQLLGFRPSELIGRRIPDLLLPEHRNEFDDYIALIQKEGQAEGLMAVRTRTGERRIWEYQNTLRTDGVAVPIIRGVARDVTEKVKAQRALRESEARLRALVTSIDELVIELDGEGKILDVWSQNDDLLAQPKEQLIGRTIFEFVGEEILQPFKEAFRRVLESGRPESFEYSLPIREGIKSFLGRLTPIPNPKGSPISLCFLARDITKRKRTEDSLRLFRALVDQSNDTIEVVDPETLRFLDVNERACMDHGFTREELLSMSVHDIDPNVRLNEARDRLELEKSGFLMVESVHKRKDGSTFPVEVAIRSIQLDRRYDVAVVRNITQRKEVQEALSRQEATVRSLFQLAKTLTSTLELPVILDLLNFQSMQLVGAESGCAGLRTDCGFSCESFFQGPLPRQFHFGWEPGVGIPGRVFETKKTYVTNDALHDPFLSDETRTTFGLRSVLCVPVLDCQQDVIAFFALHNKEGGDFLAADVEIAEGIAQVASIAIQNAQAYGKIQQAERELRRLSNRLINIQDDERRRIARELHETTAQDLAALRMSLGSIENKSANFPASTREAIEDSLQLSDKLIKEVRTISYLLHPPMLEETGLGLAVQWYANGFTRRSGIRLKVDLPENLGRLPRRYETTLFRIMQECLTNIHNHSGCQNAYIRLERDDGQVSMLVQDDGKGIADWSDQVPISATQIGVGIPGMRERVKQLQGRFEVRSSPRQGTTVRAILPIPKGSLRQSHTKD